MQHPSPSAELIDDLVAANRILARLGVVDAFGHVSARHDGAPDRFLLARNMAPQQVAAEDIQSYALDGAPLGDASVRPYLERFIHASIYRARPDVMAIVHSHSPAVIPFTVSKRATLRAVCHMSGFLGTGSPLFEVRDYAGDGTDLLVRDAALGDALAATLGSANVVLMRGHGSTTVAHSLKLAVYRAVYAESNARMQMQAMQLGEPVYLSDEEAAATMASVETQIDRPWRLWKEMVRGD